jgi:hypothetical protein
LRTPHPADRHQRRLWFLVRSRKSQEQSGAAHCLTRTSSGPVSSSIAERSARRVTVSKPSRSIAGQSSRTSPSSTLSAGVPAVSSSARFKGARALASHQRLVVDARVAGLAAAALAIMARRSPVVILLAAAAAAAVFRMTL